MGQKRQLDELQAVIGELPELLGELRSRCEVANGISNAGDMQYGMQVAFRMVTTCLSAIIDGADAGEYMDSLKVLKEEVEGDLASMVQYRVKEAQVS